MRRAATAIALWLVGSLPATGATLWGYGGLMTLPDARAVHAREIELGAHGILMGGQTAIAGYARYGLAEGWEASLCYGLPGYPYPTGALRYVVLPMVGPRDWGIALGAAMLGVPAALPYDGTNYFLTLSRGLGAWGTVHLGFQGDLALNSRVMIGYEQAVGLLRLQAEGFGVKGDQGPYASLGATFAPWSWLGLAAGTLGTPGAPVWERGYFAGAYARTTVPDFGRSLPSPSQASSVRPATPRPIVPPAPASGTLAPPPLPAATLVGRVLAPDGKPRAGFTVRLVGDGRKAVTTPTGYFFLPGLGLGTLELEVLDASGRVVQRTTFDVPATGPVQLTIQACRGARA